jgi:hypothetical protein
MSGRSARTAERRRPKEADVGTGASPDRDERHPKVRTLVRVELVGVDRDEPRIDAGISKTARQGKHQHLGSAASQMLNDMDDTWPTC